jgi:hypothetical protein
MCTTFLLIDYENVQPTDLKRLHDMPCKVRLFVGANQARIPVTLASALQPLGANAEYVLLESSGHNALDFHIAYYIGELSSQEPGATFCIVSKDTGFDPLIQHLTLRGVPVRRFGCVGDVEALHAPAGSLDDSRIDQAMTHLDKLKAARPRKRPTLLSTLRSVAFRNELSEAQVVAVLDALCRRGFVRLEGEKVSYAPAAPC